MATSGKFAPEVPALPQGMDLRSLRQGPYLQNVRLEPDKAWSIRGGLGVLREFDSHLMGGDANLAAGPTSILGVYLARTGPEGAEQLLVVTTGTANRGDQIDAPNNQIATLQVFDTAYRRVSEHVLLKRSDTDPDNMPTATPAMFNPAQAVGTGTQDVAFASMDGVVFFGSPSLGLWAYFAPTVPAPTHGDKQYTHATRPEYRNPYGESIAVTQLTPSTGPLERFYVYRTPGEVPPPTALAIWQSRLVSASGRHIYFSDPLNPTWWTVDNKVPAPTQGEITAIAAGIDVILVWTTNETWAYNPPNGSDILAGGIWYRLSDSTGCTSPRSQTLMANGVVWAHNTGVFFHQSGTNIKKISELLDPFFQGDASIQNPLSLYRLQTGATDPTVPQPPIEYVYSRPTLSWHELRGELFVNFPSSGFTLVFNSGVWAIWNTGTLSNTTNVVKFTNSLPTTELVGTSLQVLGVSLTSQSIIDRDVTAVAYTEVGRGGALDHSEQYTEDARTFYGQWTLDPLNDFVTNNAEIWVGKPLIRPAGYVTGTAQTTTETTYWFPVILIPPNDPAGFTIEAVRFEFEFDFTNWRIPHVANPTTPEIDFDLDKVSAIGGFSPGAPVAASEVRTYTGGAPDVNGNRVVIRWDGTLSVTDVSPALDAPVQTPILLCWIPAHPAPGATTTVTPWVQATVAQFQDNLGPVTVPARVRFWDYAKRHGADYLNSNQLAQAVDWAIKTDQLGSGEEQLKCRGVYARLSSSSKATTSIVPGWVFGLVNATTSSDYKDWATETIDVGSAAIPATNSNLAGEETLRSRLFVSAITEKQTYNNVARWSSTATPAHGNILNGSQPVDTFATSEGIRGEYFSTMLWGSAQNQAERLAVEEIKVTFRQVGGRRRGGR